mgnify:CR=1 FL=1
MYNWLYTWDFEKSISIFIIWVLQANINNKGSQISDLQENIKSHQVETSKAKYELNDAMTAMEQLKDGFKAERANWEIEKANLLKRAEDAEAALKPAVEELTGLKHQVNAMTSAIFGTYLVYRSWLIISKISGLTVNS